MPLTVTTVNGGAGRVVFGADGRPAHIIELGPLYIRLDLAGPEQMVFPARGGFMCGYVDLWGRPPHLARARAARLAAAVQNEIYRPTIAALVAPGPPEGKQSLPEDVRLADRVNSRRRIAIDGTSPSPSNNLVLGVPA